mmetsp:Transcript_323/g.595  ORF Transcript_323/g.595 Transcript_323/m.595 type:complete len:81 (+) Transcript_323:2695-2937(+)
MHWSVSIDLKMGRLDCWRNDRNAIRQETQSLPINAPFANDGMKVPDGTRKGVEIMLSTNDTMAAYSRCKIVLKVSVMLLE